MNHLKIYESYRGDKVIKLYKNSILHDYNVDVEESKKRIQENKNKILGLINEYVNMNVEYFRRKYNVYSEIKQFNFYIDSDDGRPFFSIDSNDRIFDPKWLIYSDIEKLLNFMAEPEVYRSANKYNL